MWRIFEAGAPLNGTNENGGSLLMSAVYHNNEKEVGRLLANGLDADHSNERGDTPLSIAAAKGAVQVMRMLVAHGATTKVRGKRGDSCLHRAARFRRTEAARYLVEELRAEVDLANRRGETPLTNAAGAGGKAVELAEMLLEHGAAIEHVTKKGNTAFLEAADAGSLTMLKMLHGKGADVHKVAQNDDGAWELSKWGRDSDNIHEWLTSIGVKERHPEEPHHHDHDHEGDYPHDD